MKMQPIRLLGTLLTGAALVILFAGRASAAPPKHIVWAERLVDTVTPAANEYGEPALITWKPENGLDHSTNRSKCASLVTRLLAKAYGKDLVAWFGCASPNAATYHDTIEVEDGFMLVETVHQIAVGDVVAIRYLDAGCTDVECGSFKGCKTSGHVALVAARPRARAATSPIVPGTHQYELDVIDSTSDVHGATDTRYHSDALELDDEGVGRGTMRLYVDSVDPAHPIVGYTWSTWSGSTFYASTERDLVIGRIRRP